MDQARATGRVTLAEMVRLTQASRNILKMHFRNLVAKQLLRRHGAGKATWYGLP